MSTVSMSDSDLRMLRDFFVMLKMDLLILGTHEDSPFGGFGYDVDTYHIPALTHREKFHYAKTKVLMVEGMIYDIEHRLKFLARQNDSEF